MFIEEWADIKGYENMYQVSNLGRVKSLKRKEEVILKCKITKSGYREAKLFNVNYKDFLVHRLVALSFIPNPENKKQVNHIDGDKLNNVVTNLEWVTSKENAIHSIESGLKKVGSKSTSSKLKQSDVIQIRKLYLTGDYTHDDLGALYNVHPTTIGKMLNGTNWKQEKHDDTELISEVLKRKYGGGARKGKIILNNEQIKEMWSLHESGLSKRKIAEHFGITHTTINRYLKEKAGD